MPGGRDFSSEGTCGETGITTFQERSTSAWKTAESDKVTSNPSRRETESETKEVCVEAIMASITEVKTSVLLHANCRSVYNKALDFWNLIDTYNPDIVGATE